MRKRPRSREARDVTDATDGWGPLDALRLIDFGQYLAGPFGPMILADLGMDVIKVEPVTGDGMRMAGKPFFGASAASATSRSMGRRPRATSSRSSSCAGPTPCTTT